MILLKQGYEGLPQIQKIVIYQSSRVSLTTQMLIAFHSVWLLKDSVQLPPYSVLLVFYNCVCCVYTQAHQYFCVSALVCVCVCLGNYIDNEV